MKLQKALFLPVIGMCVCNAYGQNKLTNPVDGKLLLSANYGELRSMHFHSGMDLKIGGKSGAKVYAVDDAFVYRLSVSPQGYGNCIYLKHPDGNITVYGHLQKFNETLSDFIKNEQYRRNSFAIDTAFAKPVFSVKRGEIIGFAGNSGTSFGPHLHFEIRDSLNIPINPIPEFYDIPDNIPPTVKALTAFTIDSFMNTGFRRIIHDIQLKNVKGKHNISKTIEVESPLFFGIETFDNVTETYNKIGVRKIHVSLDNTAIFSCCFDNLGFEKNTYINSLQSYDLLINENRNVIKTYVEPGNNLDKYQNTVNSGIVEIEDSLIHKVSITVEDDYKNKTILNFNIKAQKKSDGNHLLNHKKSNCIKWDSGGFILSKGACLLIKPKTFYDNVYVELEKSDTAANGCYSSVYFVNLHSAAVHKPFDIVIKANVVDSLRGKVMIGGLRNGKMFAVNAKYFMGFVNAKISSSAHYFVTVDTLSPLITPKFKDGEDLRKQTGLKIMIDDNLSGIQKYTGYIDGEWALFEYDSKNHLLTYTFDDKRISRNKKHKLKLIVSDNKNNTSLFESSFVW
ncbi:MAG: M23 family metallopeptidase [Prevotellaceae bacterium]|jgi:hypothetical protein|nr:M23 family metallopeptidase [Prevotellaceae bacterium]